MNEEIKAAIIAKIREYDSIIIMRHLRPDCDAVGSAMGLKAILKLSYPEKQIFLINEDTSEYTDFLGTEDSQVPDEVYTRSLGIVVDTAVTDRISNTRWALCRELIKIDHHVDIKPYGTLSWVEDERAATCEMIADLQLTSGGELKLDKNAASFIFAGLVTDSGRFRYSSVTGDTLRNAAALLDTGIETEKLYANLYLKSFDEFKFKSYVYRNIRITANGVAHVYISKAAREKFGLSPNEASSAVYLLDSIKGSLIWIAFIEYDGYIRVRLRSRFLAVNKLGERYSGGGHKNSCGATVYKKTQAAALLRDADKLLADYKANNEGWL